MAMPRDNAGSSRRSPQGTRRQGEQMGGPIGAQVQLNTTGADPGFAAHCVDVEVDTDLGIVRVLRYTAAQDVGRALHPGYVEGQIQGGVVQGIGWALSEEYLYDRNGRVDNATFLDYRMPVCSDVPMIETVVIEVPIPSTRRACTAWARRRSCRRWRPSPTPCTMRWASASTRCPCRRRASARRWMRREAYGGRGLLPMRLKWPAARGGRCGVSGAAMPWPGSDARRAGRSGWRR